MSGWICNSFLTWEKWISDRRKWESAGVVTTVSFFGRKYKILVEALYRSVYTLMYNSRIKNRVGKVDKCYGETLILRLQCIDQRWFLESVCFPDLSFDMVSFNSSFEVSFWDTDKNLRFTFKVACFFIDNPDGEQTEGTCFTGKKRFNHLFATKMLCFWEFVQW